MRHNSSWRAVRERVFSGMGRYVYSWKYGSAGFCAGRYQLVLLMGRTGEAETALRGDSLQQGLFAAAEDEQMTEEEGIDDFQEEKVDGIEEKLTNKKSMMQMLKWISLGMRKRRKRKGKERKRKKQRKTCLLVLWSGLHRKFWPSRLL
jgi:hypothetical protein